MNIQQFEYVLSLAEHKHFETAAEKCFVSQSTLSTMILKLEEELGITLFDRKKRPLEITEGGQRIIQQLKIVRNEISHLSELASEIRGELKGVIRMACIPTVAPFLLPLFLIDFARQYPDLKIEMSEMTTEDIVRHLKMRDLDIGIISTPVNENELAEYPLYNEPFILFDTSLPHGAKISAGKMKLDNFWLMEEGHCMRTQVLDICGKSDVSMNASLNISFKAGSIDSLIRFVKANKGRTLLPVLATTHFSREDNKYIRELARPVPFREIGLLTHQYFPRQRLLHLLQEEIKSKVIGKSGKFSWNITPV